MANPPSWPPRPPSGIRSIRFYATGTATATFADNAFMFAEGAGANPYTPTPYVGPGGEDALANAGDASFTGSPMGGGRDAHDANPTPPPLTQIWSHTIKVTNAGGSLQQISFDGTNVQGVILANSVAVFRNRHESGICIKGGGTFHVEAW